MKPEIIGFSKIEDKFNYEISNLKNIQLKDFGASPIYYPKVNVLNNEDSTETIDLYKNLTEWSSFFKNRYGLGQNIYDLEIYDNSLDQYFTYFDPLHVHPKKRYWGLGENDIPITIKDFRDLEIGSLYWLRINDLVFVDDFEAGFYFNSPSPGDTITISLFSAYILPTFSSLDELCTILNNSTHPAISLFTYDVLNTTDIHAQARFLSKELYNTISYTGTSVGDEFTYFTPKNVFSQRLLDHLNLTYPLFKEETLFLFSKTSNMLDGSIQDPNYWVNDYWYFNGDNQYGYLPTTIDQNVFNVNDLKIFNGSFEIPENGIATFVVNNLDGKYEFIWSLTNDITGEEIIRVKSVPFFMWKFKDIGSYSLSVEVIDNRETSYKNEVQNFIRVLNKRDYVTSIEERLNTRKNNLIKNYNF
jgi:hypothetical protein